MTGLRRRHHNVTAGEEGNNPDPQIHFLFLRDKDSETQGAKLSCHRNRPLNCPKPPPRTYVKLSRGKENRTRKWFKADGNSVGQRNLCIIVVKVFAILLSWYVV